VQDQKNSVGPVLAVTLGQIAKVRPELLEHFICHGGAGCRPVIDGWQHLPTRLGRHREYARQGRTIPVGRQQFLFSTYVEIGQRSVSFEKGMGLVEQTG
jgi:hypothetical protein